MPVVINSEPIENLSIHILQKHIKLLLQRNIVLHMQSLDVE